MYFIYCIHPQTLSITIQSFYENYKQALENLKSEAQNYILDKKDAQTIEYISKKEELNKKNDGYFFKMSNKYAHRISVYEKSSRDVGYIFSNVAVNVKKIIVFSLMELSTLPNDIYLDVNQLNKSIEKTMKPRIEMVYMEELRNAIEKRRQIMGDVE